MGRRVTHVPTSLAVDGTSGTFGNTQVLIFTDMFVVLRGGGRCRSGPKKIWRRVSAFLGKGEGEKEEQQKYFALAQRRYCIALLW